MLRRPVSFSIPINPCRHLALCPAVAKPPAIASFTFCLKRDSECIHNIIQQVCVPFYHNSGPIPKYVSFCCGCASVAIVTFSPASHSYAWHLVLDVCETEKPWWSRRGCLSTKHQCLARSWWCWIEPVFQQGPRRISSFPLLVIPVQGWSTTKQSIASENWYDPKLVNAIKPKSSTYIQHPKNMRVLLNLGPQNHPKKWLLYKRLPHFWETSVWYENVWSITKSIIHMEVSWTRGNYPQTIPNHPFFVGMFHSKPPPLRYHHCRKPTILYNIDIKMDPAWPICSMYGIFTYI
jgi:hypothetical protein